MRSFEANCFLCLNTLFALEEFKIYEDFLQLLDLVEAQKILVNRTKLSTNGEVKLFWNFLQNYTSFLTSLCMGETNVLLISKCFKKLCFRLYVGIFLILSSESFSRQMPKKIIHASFGPGVGYMMVVSYHGTKHHHS